MLENYLCLSKRDYEGKINVEFMYSMGQNRMIGSLFIAYMEGELIKEVSDYETSAEMWKTSEAFFASYSRAKNFQYKLELSNIKKGSMSVTDFVMKVKDIVMQHCTCGYKVLEEDQEHDLLNGVDKSMV